MSCGNKAAGDITGLGKCSVGISNRMVEVYNEGSQSIECRRRGHYVKEKDEKEKYVQRTLGDTKGLCPSIHWIDREGGQSFWCFHVVKDLNDDR